MRIYVDRQTLQRNLDQQRADPCIVVEVEGRVVKAREVDVHGPSKIVYRPAGHPKDGITVWIETEGPLSLHDPKEG
jgi:hypothetical protein